MRIRGAGLVGLQVIYLAGLWPRWRRFARQARRVAPTQRAALSRLLGRGASGAWARAHGLEAGMSVARFQRTCPRTDYARLAPWIERIARGERGVLTGEPVEMMEPTGGSGGATKLIPYTASLRQEFSAATGAWLFDLWRHHPALLGTRSYWSISPAARAAQARTEGGLPIGFDEDTEYFGGLERWALGQMMAVPGHIGKMTDYARWRRATLVALVEAADLGLISVWSPSFLTTLLEHLDEELDEVLGEVRAPRARQVREALRRRGGLDVGAIWPRLALISCWTQAQSAPLVEPLRRWLPGVPIQPKGLLATEGVVTIPVAASGGEVLAVGSHFYEFVAPGQPGAPRLAHQLEVGAEYEVLLTTGGGLWRYALGDVVRCVGHWHQAPMLELVGRGGRASDVCGEKLDAEQVAQGLASGRAALGLRWAFVLLAPALEPSPHYVLYVEAPGARDEELDVLVAHLEAHLRQGYHYEHCRQLGQLGPLRWRRVRRGQRAYLEEMRARGQRLGDIKPSSLDGHPGWGARFGAPPG